MVLRLNGYGEDASKSEGTILMEFLINRILNKLLAGK